MTGEGRIGWTGRNRKGKEDIDLWIVILELDSQLYLQYTQKVSLHFENNQSFLRVGFIRVNSIQSVKKLLYILYTKWTCLFTKLTEFILKDICHGHFIFYMCLGIVNSHIFNYILVSISSDLLNKTDI